MMQVIMKGEGGGGGGRERFLPIQIQLLNYFKSSNQLHLITYCHKECNLHFSHGLGDGLLGKDLFITLSPFVYFV